MKKLMLLASMVAMVLVAAAPAFAQQAATGGNAAIEGPSVEGDNNVVAQCQNLVNVSGNVVQQDVEQAQTSTNVATAIVLSAIDSSAEANAIAEQIAEQEGISIGDVTQTCEIALANAPGGEAKAEVKEGPKAEAKAEAPKAEAKASPSPAPKAEAKAQLPATGGASLFALGAGALLVTGGLVARRIIK